MSSSSSSSDDSNEESGIDNHPAPVDVALSSSSSYDDSSSEESDSDDDSPKINNNSFPDKIIGGGNEEELEDRTIKMLQNLSKDEHLQVQQFIQNLNSADSSKPAAPRLKKVPPNDLLQDQITWSSILSLGLSLVGFNSRRQASAREELNINRFISFFGTRPQALAPLSKMSKSCFLKNVHHVKIYS